MKKKNIILPIIILITIIIFGVILFKTITLKPEVENTNLEYAEYTKVTINPNSSYKYNTNSFYRFASIEKMKTCKTNKDNSCNYIFSIDGISKTKYEVTMDEKDSKILHFTSLNNTFDYKANSKIKDLFLYTSEDLKDSYIYFLDYDYNIYITGTGKYSNGEYSSFQDILNNMKIIKDKKITSIGLYLGISSDSNKIRIPIYKDSLGNYNTLDNTSIYSNIFYIISDGNKNLMNVDKSGNLISLDENNINIDNLKDKKFLATFVPQEQFGTSILIMTDGSIYHSTTSDSKTYFTELTNTKVKNIYYKNNNDLSNPIYDIVIEYSDSSTTKYKTKSIDYVKNN